jgi:hypothetical protein
MPLLTTTTLTNATIADLGRTIASHLAAAANAANKQAAAALALSDSELTEWLRSMPVEELFTAHAIIGSGINSASQAAYETLTSSGISAPLGIVDMRSVADKLAAQGREIQIIDGIPTVVTLPPPEPEPQPEA